MKIIRNLFFLLMASFASIQAQELQLITASSTFEWTGKAAFSAYSLTGTLTATNGILSVSNDSIITLKVTIDMKSLDHENGDLKKHLRSKDFFEVNTFTKAQFKLTQPAIISNNTVSLIGEMTIKDVTHPETIIASFNGQKLTFSHTMNRTIYGVKFNSPSIFKKLKENAIADQFELKGSLYFKE